MKSVLIIGGKSDIAKACASEYAKNGYNLYLAARDVAVLKEFRQDLMVKTGQKVELLEFDILDFSTHQNFYENLKEKPTGVITAVGYLGDQELAEKEFSEAKRIIDTNFTGLVSILNIVANDFEKRGDGFIVGISSVAGDRGRKANYIYGSAKAAFTTYLSGLRNRLFSKGVEVLTVKPGFVATQMTAGMDLPKKLTAQPQQVAKDIFNAQQKRKDTLYTLRIWRWIMFIIKIIPEFQFKKMSI